MSAMTNCRRDLPLNRQQAVDDLETPGLGGDEGVLAGCQLLACGAVRPAQGPRRRPPKADEAVIRADDPGRGTFRKPDHDPGANHLPEGGQRSSTHARAGELHGATDLGEEACQLACRGGRRGGFKTNQPEGLRPDCYG